MIKTLTPDQTSALSKIMNTLLNEDVIVVEGSAGVGKTFLMNEAIQNLLERTGPGKKIYCSAPTNKAVKVLKDKVDEHSKVVFITTHAALKLKKKIDYRSGKVSFKPEFSPKFPPLEDARFIVVDEASMLNTDLLDDLLKHAKKQRCKIIFVGDNKQINPVGENHSPIFERNFPTVTLTEIVRQAKGNPIIEISRDLPAIKSKVSKMVEDFGYVHTMDLQKIIDSLAHVNGTDDLKYLAWTNKEVDQMNSWVRNRIYGEPKKIELGETLVFNEPYRQDYFTSEEVKVESLKIKTIKVAVLRDNNFGQGEAHYEHINIKYYSVNPQEIEEPVLDEGGWNMVGTKKVEKDVILVVHEDSDEEYAAALESIRESIKFAKTSWKDYYEFKELFADVKYNHALTVHKSQGSTYVQTIVNVKDIYKNRSAIEKDRLLYTAVTRASKLLILYNA